MLGMAGVCANRSPRGHCWSRRWISDRAGCDLVPWCRHGQI